MHEKADTNTQMLAQYFTSSMQDVRAAESRLAVRRQTLEDEEKQLYDERTKFAVYREEFLQQQTRETNKLYAERVQLDAKWKELAQEREDLEDMVAAHEDEFQFLQQQKREQDDEKENVEYHARQIAEVAAKVELLTQQMVAREEELAKAHQEMDTWEREATASTIQDSNNDIGQVRNRSIVFYFQRKCPAAAISYSFYYFPAAATSATATNLGDWEVHSVNRSMTSSRRGEQTNLLSIPSNLSSSVAAARRSVTAPKRGGK
ncbi:hypothetical protein FI667_g490, partial [Globisporangium splendens]